MSFISFVDVVVVVVIWWLLIHSLALIRSNWFELIFNDAHVHLNRLAYHHSHFDIHRHPSRAASDTRKTHSNIHFAASNADSARISSWFPSHFSGKFNSQDNHTLMIISLWGFYLNWLIEVFSASACFLLSTSILNVHNQFTRMHRWMLTY